MLHPATRKGREKLVPRHSHFGFRPNWIACMLSATQKKKKSIKYCYVELIFYMY